MSHSTIQESQLGMREFPHGNICAFFKELNPGRFVLSIFPTADKSSWAEKMQRLLSRRAKDCNKKLTLTTLLDP